MAAPLGVKAARSALLAGLPAPTDVLSLVAGLRLAPLSWFGNGGARRPHSRALQVRLAGAAGVGMGSQSGRGIRVVVQP